MAKHPGPQAAYKRDGFAGVWRWAHGHGLKRWIKARNWAKRHAQMAKDPAGYRKAAKVYDRKVKYLRAHGHEHGRGTKGKKVEFDGRVCPGWIVRGALKPARASGIWDGECISGVRSVAESIALCEAMCGAPSCPGTCAGAATNHTCPPTHTCGYPEGAVDCTDPAGLEAYCRSHHVPLRGDGVVLPADVNHFSHKGN